MFPTPGRLRPEVVGFTRFFAGSARTREIQTSSCPKSLISDSHNPYRLNRALQQQ